MSPSRHNDEWPVEAVPAYPEYRDHRPPRITLSVVLIAGQPTKITQTVTVPESVTMRVIDHLITTGRAIVEGQC